MLLQTRGHLHLYPSTPSGKNFIRTKIATCSKWSPATGPVKYSLVDAAAAPASAAAAAVKPSVQVWNLFTGTMANVVPLAIAAAKAVPLVAVNKQIP